MVGTDWTRWFAQGGVAALWKPRGLLNPVEVVPDDVTALPLSDLQRPLATGATLAETSLLVRVSEVVLPLTVKRLRDREGVPGRLVVTIRIQPPQTPTAALLLRDHFLARDDRVDAKALARPLERALRAAVCPLIAERSWVGEGGLIPFLRKPAAVAEILEESLFTLGLSLHDVLGVEVDSAVVRERLEREVELEREAERIRQRLEFIDLWKREEMGEALAREEVERVAAHLRREGAYRDVEEQREQVKLRLEVQAEEAQARSRLTRMLARERLATQVEIDEQRLEHEIAHAERLAQSIEKLGLTGSVQSLSDPAARERLIERLIEKEMTPEQLAARTPDLAWQKLDERFGQLAQELKSEIRRAQSPAWTESLPRIGTIWMAAGLALYRVGGEAAFDEGQATPVLPLEDIGYLRSIALDPDSDDVLVGAQAGVAHYHPAGSRWSIYRFREPPKGRGGANGVARIGSRILATHSELGLHLWTREASTPSSPVCEDLIVPGRSTRGVHVGLRGHLFFSHGARIYAFDPARWDQGPTDLGVLPVSVTALNSSSEAVVAGTSDGRLFRWREGTDWEELGFRSSGPVFSICPLRRDESGGWVVGARQAAVHVLDSEGSLLREYRSRYPIRWVAAGREGVLGVDRFGLNLLVWRWDRTDAPARRIRVPDQIQHLAISTAAEVAGKREG